MLRKLEVIKPYLTLAECFIKIPEPILFLKPQQILSYHGLLGNANLGSHWDQPLWVFAKVLSICSLSLKKSVFSLRLCVLIYQMKFPVTH